MGVTEAVPASSKHYMTDDDLISYLRPELYIADLKARGKNDAIQKMVSHLARQGRIRDDRIVLEGLKAREKLGSTGIGKGVAVPHSRSTVASELTLLIARCVKGVKYDAIDGKPVHHLFLILAPHQEKNSKYLPLLGKLVELTRDLQVRRKLLKAEDVDAVASAFKKAKAK